MKKHDIILSNDQPGAIAPEMIAAHIAAIQRLEHPKLVEAIDKQPRIIEAMWFVQYMSMQPGGLCKFTEALINAFPHRIGTVTMRSFGIRRYKPEECLAVWEEIPHEYAEFESDIEIEKDCVVDRRHYCGNLFYGDMLNKQADNLAARRRISFKEAHAVIERAMDRAVIDGNEPRLREVCRIACRKLLPRALTEMCIGESDEGRGRGVLTGTQLWCFDLVPALLEFMDNRAAQTRRRIADTEVVLKVFDALDYANTCRLMVCVAGDSRFGKTESVETWAAMWPGRARVVRTPCSNSVKDLHRAVAEALGIRFSVSAHGVKEKVEYVIRFSGLMLIFDEAAFLVPSNFTQTTPPARLNWVRTAIVDRKVPCALIVTPQSYDGAVARFVRKTNYSIEQFIGRLALRTNLPSELSEADLLAVARLHFPKASEGLLELVVSRALLADGYLKAVENIARRATYNAAKRGASSMSLGDVETALAEVMPTPAPVTSRASAVPSGHDVAAVDAKPPQRRFKGQLKAAEKAFQRGEIQRISTLPGSGRPAIAAEEIGDEREAVAG